MSVVCLSACSFYLLISFFLLRSLYCNRRDIITTVFVRAAGPDWRVCFAVQPPHQQFRGEGECDAVCAAPGSGHESRLALRLVAQHHPRGEVSRERRQVEIRRAGVFPGQQSLAVACPAPRLHCCARVPSVEGRSVAPPTSRHLSHRRSLLVCHSLQTQMEKTLTNAV